MKGGLFTKRHATLALRDSDCALPERIRGTRVSGVIVKADVVGGDTGKYTDTPTRKGGTWRSCTCACALFSKRTTQFRTDF